MKHTPIGFSALRQTKGRLHGFAPRSAMKVRNAWSLSGSSKMSAGVDGLRARTSAKSSAPSARIEKSPDSRMPADALDSILGSRTDHTFCDAVMPRGVGGGPSADDADLRLRPHAPVGGLVEQGQELRTQLPALRRVPKVDHLARILLQVVELPHILSADVAGDLVALGGERSQRELEASLVVVLCEHVGAGTV